MGEIVRMQNYVKKKVSFIAVSLSKKDLPEVVPELNLLLLIFFC